MKRPFSSFLPGVAGVTGIPIWCFYTNRGQGISGFGIKDKNYPIMEFFPANQAYQYVNTYGFRTFIKINGVVVEPFTRTPDSNSRVLTITKDSFFIEEVLEKEELRIRVTYSSLNNLPLGGLIRRVEITNESRCDIEIEIIDGMPCLLPYGITNTSYKEMSNLSRSWMEVSHGEEKIPFYNLRSSTSDEAEVETSSSGYFYLNNSLVDEETAVFYDANILFSYKTDLSEAIQFTQMPLSDLARHRQIPENKVPCAFQGIQKSLPATSSTILDSVIGYATTYEQVAKLCEGIKFNDFVTQQINACQLLVDEITQNLGTISGNVQLNEYLQQSYLDNILRGGKPLILGKEQHVCHIYSRKHGDQEREYNFFSLEPKYFSQGNGNYRDVNQNRRHDVTFEPRVKEFNVWMFYSLVQSDGYNPLSIQGIVYKVDESNLETVKSMLEPLNLDPDMLAILLRSIVQHFTPGDLIEKIKGYYLEPSVILFIIESLLDLSVAEIEATFGEGYWSDHFTYNLDLIEDYLSIYPDQRNQLLFGRSDYKVYSSPEFVLPRHQRIGKTKEGKIRQFGSLQKKKNYQSRWAVDVEGKVTQTTLWNKLLLLALTKYLNLDPSGMGLEMEANKPGWNDAMNGIPGLLGSGMSETIELSRQIQFMLGCLTEMPKTSQIVILEPIDSLIKDIKTCFLTLNKVTSSMIESKVDQVTLWNERNEIKELYRERTIDYFDSQTRVSSVEEQQSLLEFIIKELEVGIEKAQAMGKGIMPTYFIHEVIGYEETEGVTPYGLQTITPTQFAVRQLPLFLEAPARMIKTQSRDNAHAMYLHIKSSGIYDSKLKMFKTSESLDQESHEIGRIRAFTPGWLERESVFLHMSYKFLLGIAKAGMWDIFYDEMKTSFVPFLDQETYGRPTTENSSFIASSVNPDPSLVGQGFVARLSGSTAEVLSMWKLMMVGSKWFQQEENQLTFTFAPNLTSDLFDSQGHCSFKLLSRTQVTLVNVTGRNTFGNDACVITEMNVDGRKIAGNKLKEHDACALREGNIQQITVYFGDPS